MKFVSLTKKGLYQRPHYRAPLAPYANWLVLLFMAGVVVLIALDYPVGTFTLASMVIVIPALIIGWFAVRGRVMEIAAEREGVTGLHPVVANRPAAGGHRKS